MLKEFFIINMVEKSAEKLITHAAKTSFNKHKSNNSQDNQKSVTYNTYNTEIYNENPATGSNTVSLICTHCGGTMTVDKDSSVLMCPYCGSTELIHENDNVKIAKIKNDTQKEIEIKKLEFEERERERKYNEKEKERKNSNVILLVCLCFFVLSIIFLCLGTTSSNDEVNQPTDPDMAAVSMSSTSFCYENYQSAMNSLKKSGFTNITCEPVYDIYFGLLSSEGDVSKIKINGITEFDKNETFPKDAEIIITYHLSYKDDPTYTETTAAKSKNDTNDTRPQKNDFDENTAKKVLSGDYIIPVPSYWDEDTPNIDGMDYRGYAETGLKTTMLQIASQIDTTDPATFEVLYDDKDNMARVIKKSLKNIGSYEFIGYDIYETDNLKGMTFDFSFTYDEYNVSGKGTWFVFPSEKDNKWIYISFMSSDNADYCYEEDFMKMINAIKKNDGGAAATTEPTESLYYSTNDKETAKDGNTGVYSYKSRGGQYSVYYIIDFDEGYVYRFIEGNGDETCDRLKIESGDLNNGIIVTYHDGDDVWSNGLHFKRQKISDILILEDNDHFETEFDCTNLNDALRLRDKKKIIDY